MRKLQVRLYQSETELAADLQAVSVVMSKSRKVIAALKDQVGVSQDKRMQLAAEHFPKLIKSIASLDDVMPNMARWISSKAHTELASEIAPMSEALETLQDKYRKIRSNYIAVAKAFSGQTSKRFRSFANQVKIHVDSAMAGAYRKSDFSMLLMPDTDRGNIATVAVMSYFDMKDDQDFLYPRINTYMSEVASVVEVRSTPFETFEYMEGNKLSDVSSAASHILRHLRSMNINPVNS